MNLRLQLNTGELISVVIQAFLPKHFSERIVFYWAKHYVSQLTEEDCTSISFSYSLIFSKFDLFPNQERNFSGVSSGKPCNSFSFRPNKAPERFSFLDLQFVTVELSKFKSEGDMSTLVKFQDIWCYILKNSMKIGQEEFKELSGRAPEMEEAMAYLRKFSNKDKF